jgi:hypothetical protein
MREFPGGKRRICFSRMREVDPLGREVTIPGISNVYKFIGVKVLYEEFILGLILGARASYALSNEISLSRDWST